MDMESRNQYLKALRKDYLKARSKKEKGKLLDEAVKRTKLNRKYLIEKLKAKSNLDKRKPAYKKRKSYYDNAVVAALAKCWRIFDRPCGQRLKPLLETEVYKLRKLEEIHCSDKVADKLKEISFRTIDEKLKLVKEKDRLSIKYGKKKHPLLYQKIPVKLSDDLDRTKLGNIQLDLVEHCGRSTFGEFISTLSTTDIASGWWEGEAVMGRGQSNTRAGLEKARQRYLLDWQEIHSDNGAEFLNWHLYHYTQKEGLRFSRSRPNKKNDNCFVEQKNWTHVKKFTGYLRYDTNKELNILNDLYQNELRLYKNFFQPVIKLISKERAGGKIHRRYDKPQTPYHRLLSSDDVSDRRKRELTKIYNSLNPAELKRTIDARLKKLYEVYQKKNHSLKVEPTKKQKPAKVRYFIAQPKQVSVR